jgi:EpsD family peptidyl-prolyl cis-trans isomerase
LIHRSNNKSATLHGARVASLALAAAAVVLLAACGAKKEGATQVAAKVNGDEITVHQINYVLQQQRNPRPEQAEAAQRRVLDQLIEQQLAVQNAEKLKLDRDPKTVQALEMARRDVLARAYLESVIEKAGKPSEDEVKKYFDAHPALFAQRKVYTFQRVDVTVPADRRADVVAHAEGAKSGSEFTDWLKSQDIKFNVSPMTQPAESLPLQIVDKVAALKDGQSLPLPQQFGVSVLTLVSAQSAPKTFQEARAPIEQFLSVDARRTAVTNATKGLKEGAKIEYMGKFAASAPAPGDAPPAPSTVPASPAVPASAAAPAPAASTSASGIDAETLKKGLGLGR